MIGENGEQIAVKKKHPIDDCFETIALATKMLNFALETVQQLKMVHKQLPPHKKTDNDL